MQKKDPHSSSFRIYYEDTDAGGIVYHANYLKFAERARSDWLRSLSLDHTSLSQKEGVRIVVHHLEIDFLAPARLDDLIRIETSLVELKKATMQLQQSVYRETHLLAKLNTSLVCVQLQGKPTGWPLSVREKLL